MTRGVAPCARAGTARSALDLVFLDVDQEEVRRVSARLDREVPEQVRLHAADADDEEGAEADGHQHDPRLVARAIQTQHGVPQGKPRARASGARTHERPPGHVQHERQHGEPSADGRAHAPGAGLPPRERDQRGADERRRRDPEPVAPACAVILVRAAGAMV